MNNATFDRKCLTQCYPKNTPYVHPILLTVVAEKDKNSCAIEPVYNTHSHYEPTHQTIWANTCLLNENNDLTINDEINIMTTSFYFNDHDFLTSIYQLHSFEQIIDWTLQHTYLPLNTIKRVHNCGWRIFHSKLNRSNTKVIDYYYHLSKTDWLFQHLKETTIENKSELNKQLKIIQHAYTLRTFYSLLKKYMNENQKNWNDIVSHYDNFCQYVGNWFTKKIASKYNK